MPALPGIVRDFKFHSNAQFIQHLEYTPKLNGLFAVLQISEKHMADTCTARSVVLTHTARLANDKYGYADIMDTVNWYAHTGLIIETLASIIAFPQ